MERAGLARALEEMVELYNSKVGRPAQSQVRKAEQLISPQEMVHPQERAEQAERLPLPPGRQMETTRSTIRVGH